MRNKKAEAHEATLLSAMTAEAQTYVASFPWATPVTESNCCFGLGGVIAIFLFKFVIPIDGTDDQLWVIVGDLPSAYLVVVEDDDPRQAVGRYCDLMVDWCNAVENAGDLSQVYPVSAPPTKENAELLRKRISFIRQDLMLRIPDRKRN